jgi:rhomboid protease GluP
MHAGIFHLLFNCLVQFIFGLPYEKQWGHIRFILNFIISGIGGNLLSAVALPHSISVGASGAIMGMFGCKTSFVICKWNDFNPPQKAQQLTSIIFIVIITMFFSFNPNVDWAGHLGGLLVGFLLGFILFAHNIKSRYFRIAAYIISSIMLIAYTVTLFCVIYLVLKI